MTDFIVRFEGMQLSHEQSEHLQAAIGAAVDGALSSAAFRPAREHKGKAEHAARAEGGFGLGGQVVYIPQLWNGRWIFSAAALAEKPGMLAAPLNVAVGRVGGVG